MADKDEYRLAKLAEEEEKTQPEPVEQIKGFKEKSPKKRKYSTK